MNEPVTVLCGGAIVDNSHAIIRCVSTHIYHLFKVSTRNREMWAARTMRSSYLCSSASDHVSLSLSVLNPKDVP